MKYKEFFQWCNERACDGCWSSATAIYCIDIAEKNKQIAVLEKRKRMAENK